MKGNCQSAVFGKRNEPHTIIIARGNEIRHVTVKPWLTAVVGSTVALATVGYLLATTYLVLRDDLIGAATARQARIQQSYEDRIAPCGHRLTASPAVKCSTSNSSKPRSANCCSVRASFRRGMDCSTR